MSLEMYWKSALSYIKDELTPIVYQDYIESLTPVYYNEKTDTFVLKADEEYKITLLEQKYHFLIVKALRYATGGKNVMVKYVSSDDEYRNLVDYDEAVTATKLPSTYEPSVYTPPTKEKYQFNPKYTFDSFVVGTNNRLAHAASLAVAQYPAQKYNPLFIYGGVGLGKTHLMQAIAQYVLSEHPDYNVVFVSSEKFTNEFIDAIRRESNLQFRNKYRNVDMLLVDDIQFLAGKEGTQEEFFHTFNDLYNASKQIILTSDKPPKEIPNLEERLRSRFECGLSCDVEPPNFETRVAILRKKAEEEHFSIGDDILEFIAEKVNSNIRELEGVLLRVKLLCEMEGGEVSAEQIKEHLSEIVTTNERRITADQIISAAAKFYDVTYNDILSSKRTSNIAKARQVGMYLTRELTDLSQQNIGDCFGGRDHSTVIHACSKIKQLALDDTAFSRELQAIISNIKNAGAQSN